VARMSVEVSTPALVMVGSYMICACVYHALPRNLVVVGNHLNGLSYVPSSAPMALIGGLRKWLKSPLPVLRSACRMVSTLISLPAARGELCPGSGLPAPLGPRLGEVSNPLTDAVTLVGGDVPGAAEDVGERRGEGERGGTKEGWLVTWVESRRASPCSCSPWTTSANEMKLRRRTSVESKDP
jgi:hypothetical protein